MAPPADRRLHVVAGWDVSVEPPGGDEGAATFTTVLPPLTGPDLWLHLGGIATVADMYLDGALLLSSTSMYATHDVDVTGRLDRGATLEIRCHPLAPLLATPRKPRARWRTRLADGGLRFHRTMLMGRMPGTAPGPPVVGPWRPVEVRRGAPLHLTVRATLDGTTGVVTADTDLPLTLTGPDGRVHSGPSPLAVPDVAPWWPHTHGTPALYDLAIGDRDTRRVGFRTVTSPGDVETDGLHLHVNGVPVFARGAVWTPTADVRGTVRRARDAGFNLLRIPGTAAYESDEFFDACDSYGVMVWQDLAFANFDYPFADEQFRATVEAEVRDVLRDVAARPSLAVVCGGSEVEQQVAMLGLDPALARDHPLPEFVAAAETGVPYVPSAPCGGDPPFRPDTGVAHYFGVGGYRRPLSDVRASHVRFAAECLAIANVPDSGDLGGVPRDEGAGWDFADVRDHYLRDLYGVDPEALRASDFEHYLDLSRAVSGDVMAEVFGEWRRNDSGCGGGLVLWLRDLAKGSGWGLLDVDGVPKVAYHHLRRLLAPVAVWTTDEGLSGIDVHVANDRPEPLRATLRVALYRDREVRVEVATEDVDVPPHTTIRRGAEQVLGHFADVSYAYRFGPPGHDLVVASLERDGALLSQAVRHPLGRTADREPNDRLGLNASAHPAEGGMLVRVTGTRFADGVRVRVPGWEADDDAFPIEPGVARDVLLRGEGEWPGGSVRALNLLGEVAIS
jgi:beta-mannosidase